MPGWMADSAVVSVNGKEAATGEPGTYLKLDRLWKDGDEIAFALPMALRPITNPFEPSHTNPKN